MSAIGGPPVAIGVPSAPVPDARDDPPSARPDPAGAGGMWAYHPFVGAGFQHGEEQTR